MARQSPPARFLGGSKSRIHHAPQVQNGICGPKTERAGRGPPQQARRHRQPAGACTWPCLKKLDGWKLFGVALFVPT